MGKDWRHGRKPKKNKMRNKDRDRIAKRELRSAGVFYEDYQRSKPKKEWRRKWGQ